MGLEVERAEFIQAEDDFGLTILGDDLAVGDRIQALDAGLLGRVVRVAGGLPGLYPLTALGFELVEDSPAQTDDGRVTRWVVVRPPNAQTGVLLARADGEHQTAAIGNQHAGRVGFFLQVDDFDDSYERMRNAGVTFLTEPRTEPYGRVAVFRDIAGNPLGPPRTRERTRYR